MPIIRTLKSIKWDLSLSNFYSNIEKIPSFLKSNTTIITIIILYSFVFVPLLNYFYILQDCVLFVHPLISGDLLNFVRYPTCMNNQFKSTIAGIISISFFYLSIVLVRKVRKVNAIIALLVLFEFGFFFYEARLLSMIPPQFLWQFNHNLPLYLILRGSIVALATFANYLFFFIKQKRENKKILSGEVADLY